jgi:hypothetical protein
VRLRVLVGIKGRGRPLFIGRRPRPRRAAKARPGEQGAAGLEPFSSPGWAREGEGLTGGARMAVREERGAAGLGWESGFGPVVWAERVEEFGPRKRKGEGEGMGLLG